jgi:hypothetical protein
LFDYQHAKGGVERDATENYRPEGIPNEKGKWLQIEITVEDEGAFTMPWSATVSYGTRPGGWLEQSLRRKQVWVLFQREASRCADC